MFLHLKHDCYALSFPSSQDSVLIQMLGDQGCFSAHVVLYIGEPIETSGAQ